MVFRVVSDMPKNEGDPRLGVITQDHRMVGGTDDADTLEVVAAWLNEHFESLYVNVAGSRVLIADLLRENHNGRA